MLPFEPLLARSVLDVNPGPTGITDEGEHAIEFRGVHRPTFRVGFRLRRTGFRGEAEQRSGLMSKTIPE
jgi:hypothetical protein